MPRYHFNVEDGTSLPDLDGTVMPDVATAKLAAVKMMGQMLTDDPATFWNGEEWHLDVTDEVGLTLFSLLFMATDAPALND